MLIITFVYKIIFTKILHLKNFQRWRTTRET